MKIPFVKRNSLARTMPGLLEDLRRYLDENYDDPQAVLNTFYSAELDASDSVCLSAPQAMYSAKPVPSAPRPAYDEGKHSLDPRSIEKVLKQAEPTFSEYLADLLRERGGRYSEVYTRAEVSRQLFHRILNEKDYRPTKDTVIQLAIGLELDLPQTQKLLEKAGFILTRSSKTDLVVQYFITRGIYSVTYINEALYDSGLPLLRTGLRS